MASELQVDELKGVTADGNITITSEGGSATMQLQQGLLKHWIHLHMNTATVDDSLNNASITDNGTGDFSHNLTNGMSSAGNDLLIASNVHAVGTYYRDGSIRTDTGLTTTAYRVGCSTSGNSFYDAVRFSSGRAGDLA